MYRYWRSVGAGVVAGVAATAMLAAGCAPDPGASVVVYSSRNEQLIEPLFTEFETQTGIDVQWVTDSDGALIQRLVAEGENTVADVLLTVDAGNLWAAAEAGLLQPFDSAVLRERIPAHLRDAQQRWYGLSVRARTIAYSTERVDPATLSTYAALAGEAWRGRLCLRTSKKVYNQSLVAMMLAEYGEQRTEEIVSGWVANLAAPVYSSDTQVLEAIAAGQCDVGIVNTYYFGRMQRDNPAVAIALYWPDQAGNGVHVNVSGAGVVRHAPNPEGAKRLIEWLSSPVAQARYAAVNLEYPADPSIDTDPLVRAWGGFRQNPINVARAGELQADAVRLMDRVGYH